MMLARLLHRLGLCLGMLLLGLSATAQVERDPTVAPPEPTASAPSPIGVEGMTVVVRDAKPYLVVGTRLVAPGEKVGMMRVERITETEVWLHDGSTVIKIPRFSGIERKALEPQTTPAVAPPVVTQP